MSSYILVLVACPAQNDDQPPQLVVLDKLIDLFRQSSPSDGSGRN